MAIAARRLGPGAGVLGSVVFVLISVVAGLAYTGTAGEGFSPFNHWFSELGETGVSQLAGLFNIGLSIASLCLAVFFGALGSARGSKLSYLYAVLGIIAGVGGAFVGVFPMNIRGPHIVSALTFFVLAWLSVALASFDLYRRPDPRFPRWLPWLGVFLVVAFFAFLTQYIPYLLDTSPAPPDRPAFQLEVALEWVVLIGIMIWILAASFSWWRSRNVDSSTA